MVPPPLMRSGDNGEKDDYEYPHKSTKDDETVGFPTSVEVISNYPNYPIPTEYSHELPHFPLTISSWSSDLPLPSQSQNTALPDNDHTASTPSSGRGFASSNGPPSSSPTDGDGYTSYPPYNPHSKHGRPIVPMIVVPITVLLIIGALVFFFLRRRKKLRSSRVQGQEMKERGSAAQPYLAPLALAPPASLPRPDFSPATPTVPEPVILGPITTSNNNYFTGIDTSDIMSVRSDERAGLGNPFADDHRRDDEDEPPPPYYPASVPPISRESSVRMAAPPLSVSSQTELMGARPTPVRSPFEDPGDDAVSEISTHDARGHGDAMSAVSDLSYQEAPGVRRELL